MNRRLASIAAVLKKDAILLWPLIGLAMVIPLGEPWTYNLPILGIPARAYGLLASGLLLFMAVQTDASASSMHDWLTLHGGADRRVGQQHARLADTADQTP
jgi:hypothetical protein